MWRESQSGLAEIPEILCIMAAFRFLPFPTQRFKNLLGMGRAA